MACLTIDCQTCVMRHTDACTDCVVTFLCEAPPSAPVVLAEDEYTALRLLQGGGLVPPIRHRAGRRDLRLAAEDDDHPVSSAVG